MLTWRDVARRAGVVAGRSGAGLLVLTIIGVLVWLPGGAAAGGTAPSNTALPVLSGKAVDGQLLETTNGTWSGTTPITYTYQWQACNRQGKESHKFAVGYGTELPRDIGRRRRDGACGRHGEKRSGDGGGGVCRDGRSRTGTASRA